MPYSLSYSNNKLVQYILSRLSMVYKAFMVSINPKNHESFPLKIIFIYTVQYIHHIHLSNTVSELKIKQLHM